MSDFQTNAGATFSVSAAAPATYDEAGYEALTFTPATAAEIVDYQGPNPEWDTVTDNSYSTADKSDQKTGRRLGSGSINLKYKRLIQRSGTLSKRLNCLKVQCYRFNMPMITALTFVFTQFK